MNSSTDSECRSLWVPGETSGSPRTSSGAMNSIVPEMPVLSPSTTALSLSQTSTSPVAGSKKMLPQEMSRYAIPRECRAWYASTV